MRRNKVAMSTLIMVLARAVESTRYDYDATSVVYIHGIYLTVHRSSDHSRHIYPKLYYPQISTLQCIAIVTRTPLIGWYGTRS